MKLNNMMHGYMQINISFIYPWQTPLAAGLVIGINTQKKIELDKEIDQIIFRIQYYSLKNKSPREKDRYGNIINCILQESKKIH